MKILRILIRNYRGFNNSGWVSLSAGFNVIVGKNNSGKTAFLESFRLRSCPSAPHKTIKTPRNYPINPRSEFEIEVSMTGAEVKNCILRNNIGIHFPTQARDHRGAYEYVYGLLKREDLLFSMKVSQGENFTSTHFPSHRGFADRIEAAPSAIQIIASRDKQDIIEGGFTQQSRSDTVCEVFNHIMSEKIFVFKAERMNIGTHSAESQDLLNPDASNLPCMLAAMQANTKRFRRFNTMVNRVLPSVKGISVVTVGKNFEIRVWMNEPDTERDDVTFRLQECGTGVGQVLSILYIVMSFDSAVIVIDEPNSFLHPGAAKNLIKILQEHKNHQYIISTHTPEILSSCTERIVHFVENHEGESRIVAVEKEKMQAMRDIVSELGVSITDVFGHNSIIWVEGRTEEACFPKILEKIRGILPSGVVFLAVRSTGDFEVRKSRELLFELYRKVVNATPLMPPSVIFSFDKEERSEKELDDLVRMSGGKIEVLPRRAYENFLLNAEAIASIILADLNDQSETILTDTTIYDWITKNGNLYAGRKNKDAPVWSEIWKEECDAPALLAKLFTDVTDGKIEYRKIKHSIALTEWFLERSDKDFENIITYVDRLVPAV